MKIERCKDTGILSLIGDDGECWITDDTFDVMMMQEMAKYVEGNVLEIGFGMGHSFKAIEAICPNHDVCEINEEVFALAEQHYPERNFSGRGKKIIGDYKTALKRKRDESYDTVFIDTDGIYDEKGLSEIHRLAKGYIVPFFDAYAQTEDEIPELDGFVLHECRLVKNSWFDAKGWRDNYERVIKRQGVTKTKKEIDDLQNWFYEYRFHEKAYATKYRKV